MAAKPNIYKRIGHRGGAAANALENTISAMAEGLTTGADMLEIDVRGTKDLVPILSQSNVQLLYGKEVAYKERDYAEWSKYSADTGAILTTLSSALEFVSERQCGILLDVKESGLENALARLIRNHAIEAERVVVALPTETSRLLFRGLSPMVPTAHKIDSTKIGQVDSKTVSEVKAEVVFWHQKALNPDRVASFHKRDIVVYGGPANLAHDMRFLNEECEVDGIVTDFPDLLSSICP